LCFYQLSVAFSFLFRRSFPLSDDDLLNASAVPDDICNQVPQMVRLASFESAAGSQVVDGSDVGPSEFEIPPIPSSASFTSPVSTSDAAPVASPARRKKSKPIVPLRRNALARNSTIAFTLFSCFAS